MGDYIWGTTFGIGEIGGQCAAISNENVGQSMPI
jgi:hypothetical protein